MTRTLGITLGTGSIGWAIVSNSNIIDMGVRIYPEGVENIGKAEKEVSRNAVRRAARETRRHNFRRKLRKKMLLKLLQENHMAPVEDKDKKDWFKQNPYYLRARALNEPLSFMELGRIFYHMAQRRGFLNTSRFMTKDVDEKSPIFVGKDNKIGINQTKASLGEKTLGAYLATLHPERHQPYKDGVERIRNRYTTRQMYIDEFEAIWEAQCAVNNTLTHDLKEKIGGRKKEREYSQDGILFFQRPLRSQKHRIGKCIFEPSKLRTSISSLPFEKFRAWQFINTIEVNGGALAKKDRQEVFNVLSRFAQVRFSTIRKKISKAGDEHKFNYKDDDKITGCPVIAKLSGKKCFGGEWHELGEKEQETIWHNLFFFDDTEKLKLNLMEKYGLDREKAVAISRFHLPDGYASLSRKAINNILPFLEAGYQHDVAIALGGVKNALGERWATITPGLRRQVEQRVVELFRGNIRGGSVKALQSYLKEVFDLSDDQLNKLYHNRIDLNKHRLSDFLPTGKEADREIAAIGKPLVIQGIFELRNVLNTLIKHHGHFDVIKIVLARELKALKKKRSEIRQEQNRQKRVNNRARAELKKQGRPTTGVSVLKYTLWEECQHQCPYTGQSISLTDLFTDKFQIEHIIPFSRSLDDSYLNKTLCEANFSRTKGTRTSYEFFTQQGTWGEARERALAILCASNKHPRRYQKYKRFTIENVDDFDSVIYSYLNGSDYFSRYVRSYLERVCKKVYVPSSRLTPELRRQWGIASLLDDSHIKGRKDHRYHALDALVVACLDRKHLMEYSGLNQYGEEPHTIAPPWPNFRTQAARAVQSILVSHKKRTKIVTARSCKVKKGNKQFVNRSWVGRGRLHKETVYGKRKSPENGQVAYHVRKRLEDLTAAQVEKIVDKNIRELIIERIKQHGGLQRAFTTQVYLPNQNGDPVPIRKVRIREKISTAFPIGNNKKWVMPERNHHAIIYENKQGELSDCVVDFHEAIRRKLAGEPIFQLPADGRNVITTLQINDFFLLNMEKGIDWADLNHKRLGEHLFRVQHLSPKSYAFRRHDEASINKNHELFFCRIQSFRAGTSGWLTFNPIKVFVDPIGKIFPAPQLYNITEST